MGRPRKSGRAAETPAVPAHVCPHCGSATEQNVLANEADFIEQVVRMVVEDKSGTLARHALENLSGTTPSDEVVEQYLSGGARLAHRIAQLSHGVI